jgi:hypothetical protein
MYIIKILTFIAQKLINYTITAIESGNRPLSGRILHRILPNRQDREIEFEHFLEAQNNAPEQLEEKAVKKELVASNKSFEEIVTIKENIKTKEAVSDGYSTTYRTIDTFKNIKKIKTNYDLFCKNPKEFCQIFLNREEKSIISFVAERISHNSITQTGFAFFCMTIPKSNELSVDGLRQILATNKILTSPDNFPIVAFNEKKYASKIFSNYNEKQIIKIFTQAYNENEFIKLLEYSYTFDLEEFPVFSHFNDLFTYIKEIISLKTNGEFFYKINKNNKNIISIDNQSINALHFKVLRNYQDLHFWGTELRHCIKSYHNKAKNGEATLIGVFKNNQPYANIEINKFGSIIQIKGTLNSGIYEENEIKKIINSYLN